MNHRHLRIIICFLLTLVFLCAGWLSISAQHSHQCADCVQSVGLCAYHAKLAEGLQQFRIMLSFAPYIALAFLLMAVSQFLKEFCNHTLVFYKVRINN